MKRIEREVSMICQIVIIMLVIGLACLFALMGCRTYYVYQFGDHPAINVDAKVDKEITPTLKASVQ